jgi:hypothetical protein
VPVEFHAATALLAAEERAIVLLEVTTAVTDTRIGGIAVELRAGVQTVTPRQDYRVQGWGHLQRSIWTQGLHSHGRNRCWCIEAQDSLIVMNQTTLTKGCWIVPMYGVGFLKIATEESALLQRPSMVRNPILAVPMLTVLNRSRIGLEDVVYRGSAVKGLVVHMSRSSMDAI